MDLEEDIPENHLVRVVNLEKVKSALGKLPGTVIADAGYGGEENCAYLRIHYYRSAESVFGQMKSNRNFRRFLLRGLPKVSLEVGWLSLSLAHNLRKWATMNQKARVAGAI